jgi:hypothetical protein
VTAGRKCSICCHANRAAIDRGLSDGLPHAGLAKRFSISVDALSRHGRAHIGDAATLPAGDEADGSAPPDGAGNLLQTLAGLQNRLLRLVARAERQGDVRGTVAVVRECRMTLETIGRLTGTMRPDGSAAPANHGNTMSAIRLRVSEKLAALTNR